jgi:hypothetical protein
MYFQLRDMWTPEASKPVPNKEFQNFVKTTKASLNKLTVKGGPSSGTSPSGNGKNNTFSGGTNNGQKKKC